MYIYIKTHNITGMKYLGITKNNPYLYKGSGIHWNNHIKKHGYDVFTEIIYESENKEDIFSAGLYYSLFYDVVKSTKWANEVNELGQGGYNQKAHKITINKIQNGEFHFQNSDIQKQLSVKGNIVLSKMWKNSTHPSIKRIKEGKHTTQIQWNCEKCNKIGKGLSNFYRWHGDCK